MIESLWWAEWTGWRSGSSTSSASSGSQLLTAGVQLGYVSVQLGLADVGVTARHYARWAGGDGYLDPMRLEAGEVPADLVERLVSPPSESLEGADY